MVTRPLQQLQGSAELLLTRMEVLTEAWAGKPGEKQEFEIEGGKISCPLHDYMKFLYFLDSLLFAQFPPV